MEEEYPKSKLRLAKPRVARAPAQVVSSSAMASSSSGPVASIYATMSGGQVVYDGKGWELLRIYLRNVVLSLLTLGLYQFYAKVDLIHYHFLHTKVGAGRFYFHATGGRKFRAFVIALIILSICLMAGWYLTDYVLVNYFPEYEQLPAFRLIFLFIGFSIFLWLLTPVIQVGKKRFLLAYTSWNNVRFQFKGSILKLYSIYIFDWILIGLTLGIYYPWHITKVKGYLTRHSCLGTTAFEYRGAGKELFGIEFVGRIFNSLTLGIYEPWFWAKKKRFHIENTLFQGRPLQCVLTGGDVISGFLVGSLMVIFTLGLGFPWAVCRWKRILLGSIQVPSSMQLATIRGQATENSGVAEALGDAGEFLEQLGELFG